MSYCHIDTQAYTGLVSKSYKHKNIKLLRSENAPSWVVGLEASVHGLQLLLLPAAVGHQPGLVLRAQRFHDGYSLPEQAEPFGEIFIKIPSSVKQY